MIRPSVVLALWLSLVPASVPAFAQGASGNDAGDPALPTAGASAAVSREELEAVATELARLRAEVAALRGELAGVRGIAAVSGPMAGTPAGPATAPALMAAGSVSAAAVTATQPEQAAPTVDMLRTQVEEMSQTKVESRSRMPVRLFGAIVSNTVGNSATANWLENPNLADPDPEGDCRPDHSRRPCGRARLD